MRTHQKKELETKDERAMVPNLPGITPIPEKTLVAKQLNFPAISREKVDQIIAQSDDTTIWGKVVEGGFKIQDKFFKTLEGVIVDLHPHLIKWENGVPTKLPNVTHDDDIPPGFERRTDVKILVGDQIFGLSLPPSSAKFNLSPYLKFLRNTGKKPEEVVTRFFSRQASNANGTWPTCAFELADSPKTESSKSYPKEWGD